MSASDKDPLYEWAQKYAILSGYHGSGRYPQGIRVYPQGTLRATKDRAEQEKDSQRTKTEKVQAFLCSEVIYQTQAAVASDGHRVV